MSEYRILKHKEVIKLGDEVDACRDGWRDDAKWIPVPKHMIGREACNPIFISHSRYRRAMEVLDEN